MVDPQPVPVLDRLDDRGQRPARFGLRTVGRGLLVALPAFLVAAIGTTHPLFLTAATAHSWRTGHLLLLPGFPLVAVAVWVVLRGERGPAAWGARGLAVAYSVLYGALDSIAGIGAPELFLRLPRDAPRPRIEDLFFIGDQLGALGVYSLAGATLLAAVVVFRRTRNPLAPVGGVLAALCCYPFLLLPRVPAAGRAGHGGYRPGPSPARDGTDAAARSRAGEGHDRSLKSSPGP